MFLNLTLHQSHFNFKYELLLDIRLNTFVASEVWLIFSKMTNIMLIQIEIICSLHRILIKYPITWSDVQSLLNAPFIKKRTVPWRQYFLAELLNGSAYILFIHLKMSKGLHPSFFWKVN